MQDALSQLPKHPSNLQTTHRAKSRLSDQLGIDIEKVHGQQPRAPQYLSDASNEAKNGDHGKKL